MLTIERIKDTALKYWILCLLGFGVVLSGCGIMSGKHSISSREQKGFDLYLLIGQSNMAGRAPISPTAKDTLEDVYLFTGEKWQAAANPLNKYSTVRKKLSMQRLGPGYSFAKKLSACTNRKIGLIVNARGGTAIAWWEKGYSGPHDYNLYEEAVQQAKKALKYGTLKGILWLQGSADKREPEKYMTQLKKLVRNLRADLNEKAYFTAGEIGKWRQSSNAINQVIRSVPGEIENAGYISADNLTPLKNDTTNPHFDTESQFILGERYADNVLKKVYHLKPCGK